MLAHILYGTAALNYGGLRITARAAGARGARVTLTVTLGSPLTVTVNLLGLGYGEIVVRAPADTTEAALLVALKAAAGFKALARVDQAGGDGTAAIAGALSKTACLLADDGLQQFLGHRIGIEGWDDRDLKASGKAVGLLWPAEGKVERSTPDLESFDVYSGTIKIVVAFQHDTAFQEQNATLDMYRRALIIAVKLFDHGDLIWFGSAEWGNTNQNKDETTGTTLDHARLNVIGSFPIRWQEPAADPEDELDAVLQYAQIGLFREPLTDPLGPGGGEVLDTILRIEP
jgi:hypothetical protein